MKLRYSPASPFVRKVMVTAHEKGLAGRIETVPTVVVPVKENPDLADENPLVKVPSLLTDEGEALFDSRVICEYLDTLAPAPVLFPAAGPARWAVLRQQALADGLLDAAILTRYERVVRPADLLWEDWVEGQMRKVRGALDALEAEAPALAGLTIGSIAAGCALGWLDFRYPEEGWRETRPMLADWFATFAQRPAMQATVPHA